MAASLMHNKNAQAAYRMARPRRRTDTNCFCGQTGTALLFGMLAGYITLLSTGLHFVTTSIGDAEGGAHGGTGTSASASAAGSRHNNHSEQEESQESMLPVLLVMVTSILTAPCLLHPLGFIY